MLSRSLHSPMHLKCIGKGTTFSQAGFRQLPSSVTNCTIMLSAVANCIRKTVATNGLRFNVDAELVSEEQHYLRRQHFHARPQPHRPEFVLERPAPVAQCADADSRTVSQFLSCHCFHKSSFLHPRLRLSIKQAFCVRLAREFINVKLKMCYYMVFVDLLSYFHVLNAILTGRKQHIYDVYLSGFLCLGGPLFQYAAHGDGTLKIEVGE